MTKNHINEFTEAIDGQAEALIDRLIEKAEKRNMSLEEAITRAFILFINEEA